MKKSATFVAGVLLVASFHADAECLSNQDGAFQCSHVELVSSLARSEMGGVDDHAMIANDLWGWTDPLDGKEYVILGMYSGTAFIDISDPENPRYLGRMKSPPATPPGSSKSSGRVAQKCHDGCTTPGEEETSSWQDVKVYDHYAYVVSEQDWFGMLVFDLHQLRGVTTPKIFPPTTHITEFRNAHNLFIHEDSGFAYVVGNTKPDSDDPLAEPNFGGLLIYDLANPENPVQVVDYELDGYVHDVVCVYYHGPDAAYSDHEICFASNSGSRRNTDSTSDYYGQTYYYDHNTGTFRSDWTFDGTYLLWDGGGQTPWPTPSEHYSRLSVLDVTDKKNIVHLSHDQHPDSTYVHQSWPSEDHHYLLVNDELEEQGYGYRTRSYTYDLSDLDAIEHVATYKSPNLSVDHNEYVKGRLVFQSNYDSGLRILDADDPLRLVEVGFFDSQPLSDEPVFAGTWSNYPYFESGIVPFSDMYSGLFLVRPYLADADVLGSDIAVDAALLDGAGGDHTFYLALANNGPGTAEEIDITLHLPVGQAFTGITDNGGATCTATGRKVICQLASLASCTTDLLALTLDGATDPAVEVIGMAAARQLDIAGHSGDNRAVVSVSEKQASVDTLALEQGLVSPACSSMPVVDAGDEQQVNAGEVVHLVAKASDEHAAIVSYHWEQTIGETVSLTATDAAETSFTAPSLDHSTDLVFEVTATNAYGATAQDKVTIRVRRDESGGGSWYWLLPLLGLLALRTRRR